MSFFNKKEEVLDVQLTQLGKYLLSKGKLKPAFYVFSDDEILYSVDYVNDGNEEKGRETSNRIQKETQRLKTLYEHDGVETRVLSLNGHQVEKPRGHGWQARIKGRTEEMPFDQAYGTDTVTEDKMGSDDRNLVRNFIGNSTIGNNRVPSWTLQSLMDGQIESVNISSSSPNVGIKRPVLDVGVDYVVEGDVFVPSDLDFDIDLRESITSYTGLEREILFPDNFKATIDSDSIVFSVVEENVDYDLSNFEFELYEIETVQTVTKGKKQTKEQLRKLYFSDDESEHKNNRYAQHYFEILKDEEVAALYGIDIHGTNRNKITDKLKKAIQDYLDILRNNPETGEEDILLGEVETQGECDD